MKNKTLAIWLWIGLGFGALNVLTLLQNPLLHLGGFAGLVFGIWAGVRLYNLPDKS